MPTPQELLQAAKGGAGNVMVNRPARRPLGVRGGRMAGGPQMMDKPAPPDLRGGPRLQTGGGIVSGAPPEPAWMALRRAGIGGQGSAAANQAMAAKLAAGGAPGSLPSGGIVAEDPTTTSRSFPGFKPAGGPIAMPMPGQVNALSVKPAINSLGPDGPVGGGIVPPMPGGGPAPKEMPGESPDAMKALTMPGTVQRPPAAGLGSTVSDPVDAFTSLGRVGAGLQMRPRRPMGDFGPPPQQGPETY